MQIMIVLSVLLLIISCNIEIIYSSHRQTKHDISTLKLLQIFHRHGDRTPSSFPVNDPFQNESYWQEGIGQLTRTGKYRLYKTGQFIRNEYHQYLGDSYSPLDVYVRSADYERCIASTSLLLAGAYPPKNSVWQWNNGSDDELGQLWHPFPVETFMPYVNDLLLEEEKPCPRVDRERAKIYNRPELKAFLDENREFYANISRITGNKTEDIRFAAYPIWDILEIELNQFNRYWSDVWTLEEQKDIVRRLGESDDLYYANDWDSPVIQRIRAGGMAKEMHKNINSVLQNRNKKKLYVYSTHDNIIALLMHSLNMYNGKHPPYGSALLFELHEKVDSYFLRAFYYNETVIGGTTLHPLQWGNCGNVFDCPLNEFFSSTERLLYRNIDEECNELYSPPSSAKTPVPSAYYICIYVTFMLYSIITRFTLNY